MPTISLHGAAPRSTRLVLPLLLGITITLILRGYQFGSGNHTVYLIEPLREVHPELLANDWWTTHTLQYHVAFNKVTALLMRMQIVEPAFLVLYLGLVGLLHVGWMRLVLALGSDERTYLLSVLLYYLSAAGTGLGSYQFLQDSSFLPGNIANVALLWGIVLWIEGRTWAAAIAMAVASLFHLNHALIALAFWPIAICFDRWRERDTRERWTLPPLLTFGLILLATLPTLLPALRIALAHVPKMPLQEFVDLYVHLRHPHHYDPVSWPAALWLSFLWPIPLAVIACRRAVSGGETHHSLHRAALTFAFFTALQLIALLLAGVVFVSEPLIQMSLFRFSIYPKLISCVGAAAYLLDAARMRRRSLRWLLLALSLLAIGALVALRSIRPASLAGAFVAANFTPLLLFFATAIGAICYLCAKPDQPRAILTIALTAVMALLFVIYRNHLGLQIALENDAEPAYLEVCRWAREHTPTDALFIVPPNEQLFRYHAQRAIVVDFKHIPQLSSEMIEWRQRLEAVLDEPLARLPHRFDLAHAAIAERYDQLPAEHLADVARRYGARYLVTARPLPTLRAVFENHSYHLYDLASP